jgi:hypothetical protein
MCRSRCVDPIEELGRADALSDLVDAELACLR